MSYSFSVPAGPKADLGDRVVSTFEEYAATPQGTDGTRLEDLDWWPTDEVRDHVKVAATAATELAGTIGGPDDQVGVSISGHANPGHAATEGYADESVHVAVFISRG